VKLNRARFYCWRHVGCMACKNECVTVRRTCAIY